MGGGGGRSLLMVFIVLTDMLSTRVGFSSPLRAASTARWSKKRTICQSSAVTRQCFYYPSPRFPQKIG